MTEKPLVINNFQKGIAPSPYFGFGDMRNLDIYSYPGIIRLNNLMTKQSSTTVTDLILWLVRNPLSTSEVWALGDTAKVYKSTDGGSTWSLVTGNSSGSGQGLAIWRDYLFVARSGHLETYGPLSSSPSWTTTWKTIDSDSAWHPMIIGQDDILYGGAGRYIFSLQEVAGQTFAPGTSSTYTWNSQALDLPKNYRVKCLAELGEKLMIGTWQGSNIYDYKIADIFPWDRTSDSFELPIRMSENGINGMITVNNLLYILAGIEGKVFVSNSTSTTEIAKIPSSIGNIDSGKRWDFYPGAIMNHQGRIFFGVGSSNGVAGSGVWSLHPNLKGNTLIHENTISTGNDGSSNALQIGALLSANRESYLAGWVDASTYGIDSLDYTKRYISYAGYFESPVYQVGTSFHPKKFQKLMLELNRPLVTNQGVKISFRTSLADSYTLIDSFDFATYGAIKTFEKTYSILADKIQIKVQLTTASNSNLSPELMSVSLI